MNKTQYFATDQSSIIVTINSHNGARPRIYLCSMCQQAY